MMIVLHIEKYECKYWTVKLKGESLKLNAQISKFDFVKGRLLNTKEGFGLTLAKFYKILG